ncbi:MAG: T9SS type A sorting domain-containing protein [Bacteroidota bacterium]|nr:T9SS type A sorting domain-containing protein [Bacteroidota bacterium]
MKKITLLIAVFILTSGLYAQIGHKLKFIDISTKNVNLISKKNNSLPFKSGKDIHALSTTDTLLMNWEDNDSPVLYPLTDDGQWGYVFGTSNYGDIAWGERYIVNQPSVINSALIAAKGTAVSNNKARVFITNSNIEIIGVSDEIAYKNMTLSTTSTTTPPLTTFNFSTPVSVTDTFYVVLAFDPYDASNSNSDQIGIYSTTSGDREVSDANQNFYLTSDSSAMGVEDDFGKLNLFLWPRVHFCPANLTVNAGSDHEIANGESVNLSMNVTNGDESTPTYFWVGTDNSTYTTKDISVSPTTDTRYYFQVDFGGCYSNIDSVTIYVSKNTVCNLSASITKTNSTTLQANGTNGTGNITYKWNNNSTSQSITIPNSTATYTVTVSDANNCSATANITITAGCNLSVSINKLNETTLQANATNGTGNITYKWNNNYTSQSITIPNSSANYSVTATDANNCTASANITITATGISSINTIDNLTIYPSPANDVLNIKFYCQEMQNTNIKIYNVIGKLVYNVNTSAINGEFNKTIDVKSFSKGLYLVQIESAKSTISRKVEIR